MSDSLKRWMAGIIAAIIMIIIAALAVGRMERNIGTGTATQGSHPAPAPIRSVTPSQPMTTDQTSGENSSTDGTKSATLRDETVARLIGQKAAVKGVFTPRTGDARSAQSSAVSEARGPISSTTPTVATQPISQEPASSTTQSSQSQPQVQALLNTPEATTPRPQPATATPVVLHAGEPMGLLKTTGNVSLNGTFTKTSSLVYANDQVFTPGQNGALLTGTGNAVVLGPNAQFTAQPNQFLLDSGTSDVNTSTGLVARVKEYTITPLAPNYATHYEVRWEGDGVYVYARAGDVDVSGPCRKWRVQQGKAVKIPDPRRCGIVWLDQPNHWPAFAAAGAGAGGAGVVIWLATHERQSAISSQAPQ